MRESLALALLVPALAGCVATLDAQPPILAEAPVLSPGHEWRWLLTGDTWCSWDPCLAGLRVEGPHVLDGAAGHAASIPVYALGETAYWVDAATLQPTSFFPRGDITLACQDVARWQASKRASPAGLPFPLYAGQRWTTQNGGTTQEWVVAGRETVDVQAGQFRTVRIVVTPRNAQGTAGAEWTLHYAPEAKAIVLSEGQPGGLGPPLAFAAMPTPAEGVRHGVVRAELVHLDLGQKVSGNPLPHRLWPDCTRFPVTPTARPPTLDEVVVRVTPGIDPHLADARVDQPLRFAATNVWDGLVVEWLPSDDLDLDADGGTSATVTPTAIGTHALSARLVAPNGTRGPAATAYVTVDPPELGARIACLGANEVPAYQPTCDPVSFQVGHGRVILDAQVQGTPCATMTLHDPAGVERTRVRGKEGLWLRIDERPDAAGTWTVRYEPHGLLLSDPEVHIRVDHMAPGGHTNLSQWTPQPC